jgi:outer membrane immunogenic protein
MKKFVQNVSVLVTTAILSTSSFAALSLKGELPSAYNWTGFYIGLNAGTVNHTMNITDNQATSFNATIQETNNYVFTGGLQLGYRRQIDLSQVSGVYGIELSGNYANANFNQQYGSPFGFYLLNSSNTLHNVFLLQLIGGLAADRTLFFLAAGVGRASISGTTTNLDGVPFFNSYNMNSNKLGFAVGTGIEYALSNSFSVRFKIDAIIPDTYTTTDNVGNSFDISNTILQTTLGINYKFA